MESFDDLLDALGGFGLYQLLVTLGLSLSMLGASLSVMLIQFVGMTPHFDCILNDQPVSNQSIPGNGVGAGLLQKSPHGICSVNGTPCDGYRFVDSLSTAVTEWDLVCQRRWTVRLLEIVQMAGLIVGSAISGPLSDWFGHKIVYCAFVFLHGLFSLLAAFSPTWETFAAGRFLACVASSVILVIYLPYNIEFLPRHWRVTVVVFPALSLGSALCVGAEALVSDFFYLHLGLTVFSFVLLPVFCLLPEGPRWLTVQGRYSEAMKVIENMARMNRRLVPDKVFMLLKNVNNNCNSNNDKSENDFGERKRRYMRAFLKWPMIKLFCKGGVVVTCSSVIFYGVLLRVADLAGDVFLNLFVLSFGMIPLGGVALYLSSKLGRRITSCLLFLLPTVLSAVCLLMLFLIPDDQSYYDEVVSALCIIAYALAEVAWLIFVLWNIELYPTVIRNTGCGFLSLMYRCGGVIAPFAFNLSEHEKLSYFIMSVLLFVCASISFSLTETKDKDMANDCDESSRSDSEKPGKSEDSVKLVG